jgi:tetratricopeptide (TPR) repeat protein
MLKDSQGTLEDLNRTNVLEPNNVITLQWRGNIKKILKDYQGALEDLNKVDVFEPNNVITLQ